MYSKRAFVNMHELAGDPSFPAGTGLELWNYHSSFIHRCNPLKMKPDKTARQTFNLLRLGFRGFLPISQSRQRRLDDNRSPACLAAVACCSAKPRRVVAV